jgi:hypothetical protein
LAIAVLDLQLKLKELLISEVSCYAAKLTEVEGLREKRKKGDDRITRFDLQISEFRAIANMKRFTISS